MVIDSSAIIAVMRNEPERHSFLTKMVSDPRRLVSAVNLVETSMVLQGMLDEAVIDKLQSFLNRFDVEIIAFDSAQALLASEGFRRFGKGRHPAQLNFGDCMAYALAKQTDEPLLFKGNDFSKTDLRIA